jgi:pimeloyl-ACP methyl ester carboxylesterase
MVEENKALGESCLNLTGPLLGHIDTISAAKDIEATRLALNEGKLNWMGFSYGTELGAAYAELYPENVRAMILDGNVDHSQSEISNFVTEMSTYENELTRFFDWCNETSSCALSGQNVAKVFDELVSNATRSPIPAPGCSGSL